MRDIITILAAGTIMTAYALVTPTIVEAVQAPVPVSQKVFLQRLVQASGDGPVSAVSGTLVDRTVESRGSALPLFARD